MNKKLHVATTHVILAIILFGALICSQIPTGNAISCSSYGNYACHRSIIMKTAWLSKVFSNSTTRKIKLILARWYKRLNQSFQFYLPDKSIFSDWSTANTFNPLCTKP